jgi:hypothetical protein
MRSAAGGGAWTATERDRRGQLSVERFPLPPPALRGRAAAWAVQRAAAGRGRRRSGTGGDNWRRCVVVRRRGLFNGRAAGRGRRRSGTGGGNSLWSAFLSLPLCGRAAAWAIQRRAAGGVKVGRGLGDIVRRWAGGRRAGRRQKQKRSAGGGVVRKYIIGRRAVKGARVGDIVRGERWCGVAAAVRSGRDGANK